MASILLCYYITYEFLDKEKKCVICICFIKRERKEMKKIQISCQFFKVQFDDFLWEKSCKKLRFEVGNAFLPSDFTCQHFAKRGR